MHKLINILILLTIIQTTIEKRYNRQRKNKKQSKKPNKKIRLKNKDITLERISEDKIDDSLQDFNVTDQYQVAVNPRDQAEFDLIFDIDKMQKNSTFQLAYLVKKEGSIQFQIMDMETTDIIYDIKDQYAFMGKLKFKSQQRIKLIFRNMKYNKYCELILGFYCQNCDEGPILAGKEDVEQNKLILDRINQYKNKSDFISKVFKEKQFQYLKNLKKAHGIMIYWFIFELAGIISIGIFQIIAIKNLLNNKNIFQIIKI